MEMDYQMPSYQGIAADEQLDYVNGTFQVSGLLYTHVVSSEEVVCPRSHDGYHIPAAVEGVRDVHIHEPPSGVHSHHAEAAEPLAEAHKTVGLRYHRDNRVLNPEDHYCIHSIGCHSHNHIVHLAADPGRPRPGREERGDHSFASEGPSALDVAGMPLCQH
ncbi:hypothetical protein AKAW_05760 [Aspergillus luchuensis IFO 4308]|nr:hypothetical protein AKAW_05760 [Aspergillus luchuensis IFO 4308]